MYDQGYISRKRYLRARKSGLGLKRGTAYTRKREGYFFDFVRQQLIDRYGENRVERGGFRVYTTIDPELQRKAEEAIARNLYLPDDPEAAIVMIDARTGYIRAMASSQRYGRDSQFNFAAQALRQPGSTFKTFVLTRAIEEGVNPYTTLYESKPIELDDPRWGPIDVHTYSDTYRGAIPIAEATLHSDNSVFIQMTLDLGPDNIVELAHRMGIRRKLPIVPSIGLGSGEVTPLDMAVAYAPLANGGLRVKPIAVASISGRGADENLATPRRTRVFSDGVAYEVTRILQDNIQSGTGTAADIGVPAAGKTGTTDDYTDAWFVGYTPHYVTAVWVGYPNTTERRSMYVGARHHGRRRHLPRRDLARLHVGGARGPLRDVPRAGGPGRVDRLQRRVHLGLQQQLQLLVDQRHGERRGRLRLLEHLRRAELRRFDQHR